jgi:iron complex transport system ATP-binding protein
MLTVTKVTVRAGDRTLCRDLTAAFGGGECWAVLGPNGSGKTTLLHTLAGLRVPANGAIELARMPIADYSRREVAQRIGLLLQEENAFYWGTTLDYALLGAFARTAFGAPDAATRARALDALAAMALTGFEDCAFAALSGGERQRARIAQLVVQDTEILLLDEPLLHLDLKHQMAVMAWLRRAAHEAGKLVIMVLHDTIWASRFCDRVLLLYDGGRVISGLAPDVLRKDNLEQLYGCAMDAFGLNAPA